MPLTLLRRDPYLTLGNLLEDRARLNAWIAVVNAGAGNGSLQLLRSRLPYLAAAEVREDRARVNAAIAALKSDGADLLLLRPHHAYSRLPTLNEEDRERINAAIAFVDGGGADPSASIPAFMVSGAWWDSTSGLSPSAWVDRVAGLSVPAIGTPLVMDDELNGKPVVRTEATPVGWSQYSAAANPLGGSVSAFSAWSLSRLSRVDTTMVVVFELADAAGGETGSTIFHCARWADVVGVNPVSFVGSDLDTPGGYSGVDGPVVAEPESEFYLQEVRVALGEVPQFFVNGIVQAPYDGAIPVGPWTFETVGIAGRALAPNGGRAVSGDLAMAGCVPFALTDQQRQALYDWVTAVYGLTLPPA